MSTLWAPCKWCGQSIDAQAPTEQDATYGTLHPACAGTMRAFRAAGSASPDELAAIAKVTHVMDRINASDIGKIYSNKGGARYNGRPKGYKLHKP